LTDGKATGTDSYQPTWSPEGREIAFMSTHGGDVDIHVIPSEGGEARLLTSLAEEGWQPDWSPDGEWLVLHPGKLVPAVGGDPEVLTEGGGTPRWSRDGKQVFFDGDGERAGNLWAMTLEDRSERPMTDLVGRGGTLRGSCTATDGQYLYFCWGEDLGDIWVMDVVDETGS
jgi:Tol biopolymer transport system component